MKKIMSSPLKFMSVVTGLILALFLITSGSRSFTPAYAAGNFASWAWSANTGWINLNGSNYGVTMNPTTGVLTGYGWSSNLGWISFNSDATGDCYKFNVTTQSNCQAKVNLTTGKVTGTARVCSYFASGCSGQKKSEDFLGGWDGYIALSGANFSIDKQNNNEPIGFAWGSEVMGWIEFVSGGGGPEVKVVANEAIDPKTGPKEGIAGEINPTVGYMATGNPTSCVATGDWKTKPNTATSSMTYQNQGILKDAKTYTYTLTCTYADGKKVTGSDSITVKEKEKEGEKPSVSLVANPTEINKGGSSTLTWTVKDADSCTASGDWSGTKNKNGGSQSTGILTNSKTYSYTLTCTNEHGTTSDTATVTVKDNANGEEEDPNGGGSGSGSNQCTNIPKDKQKGITFPPYRKLPDGRCLCVAGYVLNAEYKCVKPVYTEH